jgi:plasmid stability protein
MGQVLIRNVPDDVIDSYKAKARIAGVSLEQYLRNLLESNMPFTPDERVAFVSSIKSMNTGPSAELTKDEIREGLE